MVTASVASWIGDGTELCDDTESRDDTEWRVSSTVAQIRLLGGIEVLSDAGDPIDVGPAKCQALLAALALAPGAVVPVHRLVELVWGQHLDDRSRIDSRPHGPFTHGWTPTGAPRGRSSPGTW